MDVERKNWATLLILQLCLVATDPASAVENYSSWKKEKIIEISLKYIQDTKVGFERRAAGIREETGEVVVLDYQYLHEPKGDDKKEYDKFVAGKVSTLVMRKHVKMFLKDLERVRLKLVKAEETAFASWAKKPADPSDSAAVETTAEIFGQTIESRRMGAILDNSPSMQPHLEKLREELGAAFPNYRYLEVWGSFLKFKHPSGRIQYTGAHEGFELWYYARPRLDQNPFEPRFFNADMPKADLHYFVTNLERDNLSAIRALVELEGVDAVYWFCDMDDSVEKEALSALAGLLKKHQAKLFIHTLKSAPSRRLREIAEGSGGAVIRKRIK